MSTKPRLIRPGLHTLFFTGVGGTGKTTVAELVQRKHKDKVVVAPSYTREGYKLYGITSEKQKMRLSFKEQAKLQVFLLDYYLNQSTDFIRKAVTDPKVEVCILQRSPLDYVAHTQQVSPGYMDWKPIRERVSRFLDSTYGRHVYFPYPVPWWSKREDGFREVVDSKDSTLDMDLVLLMRDFRLQGTIYLSDFDLQHRVKHLEDSTGLSAIEEDEV